MKLKKINFLFFICLIILVTTVGFNFRLYLKNKELDKEILIIQKEISKTYDYLNSLTINNFEEKVISDDDFYVYIGRPDCGDCMLFEPMFEGVVKEYNLENTLLYLNVKHFRESNKDRWNLFKSTYGFTQTPALIRFSHGKNISIVEWDTEKGLSKSRLIDWLQNNNLIKK